jgi:uncharacterized membrane protein
MEILNNVAHILLFALMLLMYYRMYTTHRGGARKMHMLSWCLLRLSMLYVLGTHLVALLYGMTISTNLPLWQNLVSWIGTPTVMIWAQWAHGWKLWENFKQEAKRLPHIHTNKRIA